MALGTVHRYPFTWHGHFARVGRSGRRVLDAVLGAVLGAILDVVPDAVLPIGAVLGAALSNSFTLHGQFAPGAAGTGQVRAL